MSSSCNRFGFWRNWLHVRTPTKPCHVRLRAVFRPLEVQIGLDSRLLTLPAGSTVRRYHFDITFGNAEERRQIISTGLKSEVHGQSLEVFLDAGFGRRKRTGERLMTFIRSWTLLRRPDRVGNGTLHRSIMASGDLVEIVDAVCGGLRVASRNAWVSVRSNWQRRCVRQRQGRRWRNPDRHDRRALFGAAQKPHRIETRGIALNSSMPALLPPTRVRLRSSARGAWPMTTWSSAPVLLFWIVVATGADDAVAMRHPYLSRGWIARDRETVGETDLRRPAVDVGQPVERHARAVAGELRRQFVLRVRRKCRALAGSSASASPNCTTKLSLRTVDAGPVPETALRQRLDVGDVVRREAGCSSITTRPAGSCMYSVFAGSRSRHADAGAASMISLAERYGFFAGSCANASAGSRTARTALARIGAVRAMACMAAVEFDQPRA